MTRKIILLSYLILNYICLSHSQEIITQKFIIISVAETNDSIISHFTHLNQFSIGHLDLKINETDLMIKSFQFEPNSTPEGLTIHLFSCVKTRLNLIDNNLSFIEKIAKKYDTSNLIHDASSVIINDRTVVLDQAYLKYHIQNPDDPNDTYYHNSYLETVSLSNNRKFIGGIVQWSLVDKMSSHFFRYTYKIYIWDAENGEALFSHDASWNAVALTIDLRFILNDRFLLARLIRDEAGTGKLPWAHLLDMETYEFIPVNRDVALTSDNKYYVTERDGLPSLVETATHEVIQRYDPGSPMTACCFSPDDRTLYIACEDLQIYAFDSHLPSAVIGWELYE